MTLILRSGGGLMAGRCVGRGYRPLGAEGPLPEGFLEFARNPPGAGFSKVRPISQNPCKRRGRDSGRDSPSSGDERESAARCQLTSCHLREALIVLQP